MAKEDTYAVSFPLKNGKELFVSYPTAEKAQAEADAHGGVTWGKCVSMPAETPVSYNPYGRSNPRG